MNNAPYTVHPMTPLTRVFNLFRTMGLRHIVVVDSKNACVGIITRWDLCGHLLEHRYGPYAGVVCVCARARRCRRSKLP